jgi:hypothetical protein
LCEGLSKSHTGAAVSEANPVIGVCANCIYFRKINDNVGGCLKLAMASNYENKSADIFIEDHNLPGNPEFDFTVSLSFGCRHWMKI